MTMELYYVIKWSIYGRQKSSKVTSAEPKVELVIDGKYISEVTATADKLGELVKPLPLSAILMWIDAHADDEETDGYSLRPSRHFIQDAIAETVTAIEAKQQEHERRLHRLEQCAA